MQIFGTLKSQATKKALRFFKERGVSPHFVDLRERAMAPGELKRFVQKFGLNALIDTEGKAYHQAGLEHMRVGDEAMMQRLIDEPALMVQPLVRSGDLLGIGWDEELWREWCKRDKLRVR